MASNQAKLQVIVIAIIAAALVVAAYTSLHRPFISPLTTISPVGYLPLIVRQRRAIPDPRFGLAEYGVEQMLALGFPHEDRYHSIQHKQPEEWDSVRYLRPASRDPYSTWQLGTYDTEIGRWTNELEFRQFVRDSDVDFIVGNELMLSTPIGDSHVTPEQYAKWYRDAWELIKSENPNARVGPFGPVAWSRKLVPVWDAYLRLTGELMPVDFYPVHRYLWPGQTFDGFWLGLTDWVGWLESFRGRAWAGPRVYWVNEVGIPEWEYAEWATPERVLAFMADVMPRFKENDLGITSWAWWPSGPNTALIRGKTPTDPGELYLELALK